MQSADNGINLLFPRNIPTMANRVLQPAVTASGNNDQTTRGAPDQGPFVSHIIKCSGTEIGNTICNGLFDGNFTCLGKAFSHCLRAFTEQHIFAGEIKVP